MSTSVADMAVPFEAWRIGKCLYACTPCRTASAHSEKIFNCSVDIIKHAQSAHGMNWKKFTSTYAGTRIKHEVIRCEECGETVTYDRGKMEAHMIAKHAGMELKTYYDKHVAKEQSPGETNTLCKLSSLNV